MNEEVRATFPNGRKARCCPRVSRPSCDLYLQHNLNLNPTEGRFWHLRGGPRNGNEARNRERA